MKSGADTAGRQEFTRSNSSVQRLDRRLRIGRYDFEQHPRRAGWPRTALFPVLQRAQVYANELGELRLADLCRLADRAHVGLDQFGRLRVRS